MRHVIITLMSFVMSCGAAFAKDAKDLASFRTFGYSNSIIFVENGVTFSVFPDGEFDFFIDNPAYLGAAYRNNGLSISFNAGFNYSPWVQYDDYGAVIQIENTPVYYDFYGRVNRIGGVNIYYNRGRISRVGGLYVYYDPYGGFGQFRGYINVYNRHFMYRPAFNYFVRPSVGFCLVNTRPYRRYYQPVRYTYYRPYRNNYRRAYANVGRTFHYKEANPRRGVYRNDRRVAKRNDFRTRNEVRDRSLNYVNSRGYNKNDSYTRGKKGRAVANNRGNGKSYKGNSYNGKRKSTGATSGRGYAQANRAGNKVTTTRSTTVKRPGKTVTKTTRVTRSSGAKAHPSVKKPARKNRSYTAADNSRKASKGRDKSYRSKRENNSSKASRSNGRSRRY